MSVRSTLVLVALLAGRVVGGSQEPHRLTLDPRSGLAELQADSVRPYILLEDCVRLLGRRLEVTAEALDRLAAAPSRPTKTQMSLETMIECLAGRDGLEVTFEEATLVRIDVPRADAGQRLGVAARSLSRVLSRPLDPMIPEALLGAALVATAEQRREAALIHRQAYLDLPLRDSLRAEVFALAMADALALERPLEARRIATTLLNDADLAKSEPGLRVAMRLATLDRAEGRSDTALLRITSVLAMMAPESRWRALGILLLADLHLTRGEGAEGLEALRSFDPRLERLYPDLAVHLPLFRAACAVRSSDPRTATASYVLASLVEGPPELRARAVIALARHHAQSKDPLTALSMLRSLARLDLPPLVKAPALEAEMTILGRVGLLASARARGAELRALPGLDRTSLERVATLEGGLLEADGQPGEARSVYASMDGDPEWVRRRDLFIARCFLAEEKPVDGQELLRRVDPALLPADLQDDYENLRARLALLGVSDLTASPAR